MYSTSRLSCLSFILAATAALVLGQEYTPTNTADMSVQTIPAPNGAAGWCYYKTADGAPPVCNSDCQIAFGRLCAEDLDEALTTTQGNCEVQYLPPVWPFLRNGAHTASPTEAECGQSFNGILEMCGKDAGTPQGAVDTSYCTTSGGGGTFGWNDDGSVVQGSARYIVKTKGFDSGGQAKAPWQEADAVVEWNPSKHTFP